MTKYSQSSSLLLEEDIMAEKPKRPRVQLDFTPEAYDRVKELAQMSRADSIPDMFRIEEFF